MKENQKKREEKKEERDKKIHKKEPVDQSNLCLANGEDQTHEDRLLARALDHE